MNTAIAIMHPCIPTPNKFEEFVDCIVSLLVTAWKHKKLIAICVVKCVTIIKVTFLCFIIGAVCHYLLLMLCFWLLCYVANTFLLIVLEKRHIFTNPKLHVAQLMLCTIAPSIFVAICLLVEQPGYHMIFKDRMAILPSTYILVFGTITLPVLLITGASLTMLIAVVRRIRKVCQHHYIP